MTSWHFTDIYTRYEHYLPLTKRVRGPCWKLRTEFFPCWFGEQGWHTGESARFPPVWPGFNSGPVLYVGWICSTSPLNIVIYFIAQARSVRPGHKSNGEKTRIRYITVRTEKTACFTSSGTLILFTLGFKFLKHLESKMSRFEIV